LRSALIDIGFFLKSAAAKAASSFQERPNRDVVQVGRDAAPRAQLAVADRALIQISWRRTSEMLEALWEAQQTFVRAGEFRV
jgi:hypothetical protein